MRSTAGPAIRRPCAPFREPYSQHEVAHQARSITQGSTHALVSVGPLQVNRLERNHLRAAADRSLPNSVRRPVSSRGYTYLTAMLEVAGEDQPDKAVVLRQHGAERK